MARKSKITMTKRISVMGRGMGVYINKNLGFQPGDFVNITLELTEPVSRDAMDEAKDIIEGEDKDERSEDN